MVNIEEYAKGALIQDKASHYVYDFSCDARSVFHKTNVFCRNCGEELEAYYCEDRLFVVRCLRCRTTALTYAKSKIHAAELTLGGK